MLKDILKQKKVTQQVVAQKLGVSQQLVSFWCTGAREPQIRLLKPLSKILNVEVKTIVDCFTPDDESEVEA